MATLNKIFLIGNLTEDPELKQTRSGKSVAVFGLAVDDTYRRAEGNEEGRACFVDIVAWERQAELCAEYLKKGSLAFVEGRLVYRTWEDDEGTRWSKLEVYAFSVQFL